MVSGAAVAGLAVVLAVEVQLARTSPALAPADPFDLDGVIGAVDGGPEPLRVVWLGDSTAAGVGVDRADDALPRQVARALGRPVQLTVVAHSGDRVGDVMREQVSRVVAADPQLIFLDVGANDVVHGTSRKRFRRTYRQVLDALPAGVPIVVLGVPDMGSPPRLRQPLRAIVGWRGRTLDRVVEAEARRRALPYVDIAAETGPLFRADPDRWFSADKYHPNGAGYGLWADAVLAAIAGAADAGDEVTGPTG